MAFKYTTIFFFILQTILTTNGNPLPKGEEIVVKNRQPFAPCSSYYGLFFIDNTAPGHKMLSQQLSIVDGFFRQGNSLGYEASATVTSQSNYSIANDLKLASPNDYSTLNEEIFEVLQQNYGGDNVSFLNLSSLSLELDLSDSSKFSKNPILVYFVSSPIEDLKTTAGIIQFLQKKGTNRTKILSVVMDQKYAKQAEELVGGKENVFVFDNYNKDNFYDVNRWILTKSCPSVLASCNGYANFVIDATQNKLTGEQYKKELQLIQDYALPMWNNYKQISVSIILGSDRSKELFYRSNSTFESIKTFISSTAQSIYTYTDLAYGIRNYFNSPMKAYQKQMSTFVFVANLSDYAVQDAASSTHILSANGKLNFITLGGYIKNSTLDKLSYSNATNWDFSDSQITRILTFIRDTMNCF